MKLDLILENVRNNYSLGLLEESESLSEKELLQGKILINESTMAIRSMLVEEGTIRAVQDVLEEAWSDAVLDAASSAYDDGSEVVDGVVDSVDHVAGGVQGAAHGVAVSGGLAYGDAQDGTKDLTYGHLPKSISDLAVDGYDSGYNPDMNVADSAKFGSFVGEHPVATTALAAGGLAAGILAADGGVHYMSRHGRHVPARTAQAYRAGREGVQAEGRPTMSKKVGNLAGRVRQRFAK